MAQEEQQPSNPLSEAIQAVLSGRAVYEPSEVELRRRAAAAPLAAAVLSGGHEAVKVGEDLRFALNLEQRSHTRVTGATVGIGRGAAADAVYEPHLPQALMLPPLF